MNVNEIEVTKEEEEVFKTMAEMGRVNVDLVGFNTPTQMGEPLPNQTPTLDTVITNICTQLQLLSTVIKEGAGKGNSLNAEGQNDNQSLQECVSSVLENSDWFKEMIEEKVGTLVDDMDHTYNIEQAVETYFNNSFCLDDHVDLQAEIESRIDEVVERVVEEKINDATITIDL